MQNFVPYVGVRVLLCLCPLDGVDLNVRLMGLACAMSFIMFLSFFVCSVRTTVYDNTTLALFFLATAAN